MVAEDLPWEVFRGHLLDPAHARSRARFASWHVYLDDAERAPAPLISLKFQVEPARLFVTRQILTHAFEAYEDAPGVILTRPVQKWVAELIGTLELEGLRGDLNEELSSYVLLSVIGTSRLPITSLESPLPAFSLGQLAYLPRLAESDHSGTDPLAYLRAALDGTRPLLHRAKALETALRATTADDVPAISHVLAASADRSALFRAVFNGAALSPYTGFVERFVAVVVESAATAPGVAIDTLGYMLRHLCRHLTAFDLTLFHNFGANYPDTLFLDALLTAYLRLLEEHPELFLADDSADSAPLARQKRLRRRALRHAALARRQYEGHRVPDAPTSMGENTRVLPALYARVPEEQILETSKRQRRLFADRPWSNLLRDMARRVLAESIADLSHAAELRELGMAHFLDRPLGVGKLPGEVDRTPLLSYEAFSRTIVKQRLAQLKAERWLTADERQRCLAALDRLPREGVPVASVSPSTRPGVVSVSDAQKVTADFTLLRTTRGSLHHVLSAYDWRPLARIASATAEWLASPAPIILIADTSPGTSAAPPTLRFHDRHGRLRLELGWALGPDRMARYVERAGNEWLQRLQILRVPNSESNADSDQPTLLDVGEQSLWIDLLVPNQTPVPTRKQP